MVSECKLVINVTIKSSVSIVSATWYSIKFMKFRISWLKKRSVLMSTPLILSVITDSNGNTGEQSKQRKYVGFQKKQIKKNTMTLSFLFACSVSPCPSFFLWTVPSNLKAGILIINLNDCFPHWHSNLFYLTTMFKTQINLTPFSWMTRWLSLSKRSLRCRSNTLKTFKNCWMKQIRDCKKWRQNTTNRTVLL